MEHEATLRRVVDLLNGANIAYMVCGSVASSHYGQPRSTHDIDIVIRPTPAALEAFLGSLSPGYYVSEPAARDALRTRGMFNAIDLDTGIKVDLIVLRDAPFDDQEFARRQPQSIAGTEVMLISPEDAILSKLVWANLADSDRQVDDVRQILAVQRTIDVRYLNEWAHHLGVAENLRKLLDERPQETDG
jgi:hypothetical protein